jgi:hypothetical protein
MKLTVVRACGHEEQVEVFGSAAEREKKIKWYETTDCKQCYAKEQNSGSEEITMKYSEYKNNFSSCKTKPDSYNREDKTIVVYINK